MKIPIRHLRAQIQKTLHTFRASDAKLIVEYLLWAEMSGNKTQGLIKLTGTEPLQNIKPKGKMVIEKDTKISQIINARANPAILATAVAVKTAISKAKRSGIAIIGVNNTFSSNGAQAYYAEKIASEDLIGIICSRSPASTTGFGSIDPLFGTNPVGFGFPTKKEPLVFDMATSAMTFYGLILAKARGEHIPSNMAIDTEGLPTIDPAKAIDGALFPFDRGYKGAGLAMVIEILAGPLIGAAYIDNKTFQEPWGTLVIAIDPDVLVGTKKFKAHCSALTDKIKSSRTKDTIRLPGERARASYRLAKKTGLVDVEDTLLKELGYI